MKLILTAEVDHLGTSGDIVEVKDGYGRNFELPVKSAGDSGKLFGSVTGADVVAAIKKAGGPNLDKRTVQLPKAHIKSVGTHPITVRLHPEVNAALSLSVVAG